MLGKLQDGEETCEWFLKRNINHSFMYFTIIIIYITAIENCIFAIFLTAVTNVLDEDSGFLECNWPV